MKNRFFISLVVCMAALASCSKDDITVSPYLEPTYNNIAGSWKLESFDNGTPVAENTYHYMNFVRKTRTFQEYTNLDSQNAVRETGYFRIVLDEESGSIIRGIYDNKLSQEWNHWYVITELTMDRMVWTAEDDPGIVNVYVRSDIPDDILSSCPSPEDE